MMVSPADIQGNVFAFEFKAQFPVDGWMVYNAEDEYRRMVRTKGCLRHVIIFMHHIQRVLVQREE